MSVNKAILIGHVGGIRQGTTNNGTETINFGLATNHSYKNKSGEKVEETVWHQCAAFGKTAEILNQYLKKGAKLYVEGRITSNKYADKDGIERESRDVYIAEFQFLDNKKEDDFPA